MVDILAEVKRDLAFMGWKGEAASGFSHKENAAGETIARHHDATWVADVEEATKRAERVAALHELQRRNEERGTNG